MNSGVDKRGMEKNKNAGFAGKSDGEPDQSQDRPLEEGQLDNVAGGVSPEQGVDVSEIEGPRYI